ncbi:metallophosphoesterase [Kitasatospora herbaricolor]|uniref:Metallophosphoesterase n=1 Tax=Kitasatospora herbaricolor TaxID=68217 RepID=A0ABZ1WGM4_9ACTN|nr:metallophosphoesterase [Kitasatospora herbaricolor]
MLTIAHLSDIHIGQEQAGRLGRRDGGARALVRAELVMEYLNGLPGPLDAVLVTGDIADHGTPAEYEKAAKLLVSPHPVLTCPGNHDRRAAFRRGLLGPGTGDGEDGRGGQDPDRPVNQVRRLPGVTFLLCDSSIPGRDDGLLDDGTLDWLDRTLGEGPQDEPAIVAFHHPPVALHLPWVDRIRQHGEERLAEVLSRNPRVAALLCGHAHTGAATTFAGLPLLAAPGVVSTVTLPCEGGAGIAFDQPPVIAFHVLDDTGRLTTHYRVVV